jgi:signal transduction histidine kinase
VAIENAQLYAESEQRRQELDSLYRADEALHRSLRLDDVLRALADVATDVLQADKTAVHVWVPDRRRLVAAAAHGYSDESLVQELTPGEDIRSPEALGNDLLVVDEALRDERLSPRLMSIMRRENIHSAIAAPITLSGQFFGLFSVAFCQRHNPTHEQQRLVQALAQRAGLAIQNARLFEQAQQVATAEERQRLARELHDAVTQTLFSASLIAEVVPRLWERNQDDGRKRLEELRRLTRGALAEMRTLLLELRPAALIETPFVQLVNQLGEAAASRSNLEVSVRSEGEPCPVPPEVQIALYRIAQEALNNTGKHAAATHAELHLRWRPDGINVRITDNGRGFDPRATPPGHLGMGIMQERARAIGARLRVESRPGNGTRISVQWRGA